MNISNLFQKRPYLLGALIICSITIIYLPAMNIYLIGDDFVCLNEVYSGWENPLIIFKSIGLFFRPILQFTYLVKYTLFQQYAPLYIAGTLLFHLVNVFLLYSLLLRITEKIYLAVLVALLFGTSPMYSEAVLWSGGHSDSILTSFFLSTFLLLARREEYFSLKRQLAILLCVLGAICAKGTWLILPFLVAGFLVLIMKYSIKKAIVFSIPEFLLMGVYFSIIVLIPYLKHQNSPANYMRPNIGDMIDKMFYLLYKYIGLGNYYNGHLWQYISMTVLVIGVIILSIVLKNSLVLWSFSWMFLSILITLPVQTAPLRYNYMPLIGFWIMVVALNEDIIRFAQRRFRIQHHYINILLGSCIIYILIYNAIMLQIEIQDYRSWGNEHKAVVHMYDLIRNHIPKNTPLIFVNRGTRKAVTELSKSFKGYSKVMFVRSQAIWELVDFAPLANFAGEPFQYRMIDIPQEQIGEIILQKDFEVIVFTDQGFFFSKEAHNALHKFYLEHQKLPNKTKPYLYIPVQS